MNRRTILDDAREVMRSTYVDSDAERRLARWVRKADRVTREMRAETIDLDQIGLIDRLRKRLELETP